MTDIYVDATVAAMPDAANHLAHLLDTGHRLILIDSPTAVATALPGATVAEALPESVAPGSWHVSADPEICSRGTSGLRTLLVGPRVVAPTPRPGPRCDAEARNLASAVLEILGREVMG